MAKGLIIKIVLAHSIPLCELLGRFNINCGQHTNFCKADKSVTL